MSLFPKIEIINDLFLDKDVIKSFLYFFDSDEKICVIKGKSGSGKKSLIKGVFKSLDIKQVYVNVSDYVHFVDIKTYITDSAFAKYMFVVDNREKIIVIDNIEYISQISNKNCQKMIKELTKHFRVILIQSCKFCKITDEYIYSISLDISYENMGEKLNNYIDMFCILNNCKITKNIRRNIITISNNDNRQFFLNLELIHSLKKRKIPAEKQLYILTKNNFKDEEYYLHDMFNIIFSSQISDKKYLFFFTEIFLVPWMISENYLNCLKTYYSKNKKKKIDLDGISEIALCASNMDIYKTYCYELQDFDLQNHEAIISTLEIPSIYQKITRNKHFEVKKFDFPKHMINRSVHASRKKTINRIKTHFNLITEASAIDYIDFFELLLKNNTEDKIKMKMNELKIYDVLFNSIVKYVCNYDKKCLNHLDTKSIMKYLKKNNENN